MKSNVAIEGSNRDYRWDNIKFLLILLVVTGHFLDPFKEEVRWIETLWLCIYMFHMPAFFFVAGMFAKSTVSQPKKLVGRVAAYVRLYFYYEFAIFLIKVICSEEHKAVFRLFRENLYPWFLFVLAVFLVVAYAVRKLNPAAVLCFAVFFGCMAGYDPTVRNLFCAGRVFAFLPFFLLGFYSDRKTVDYLLDRPAAKIISAAGLLSGFAVTWLCAEKLMLFKTLFTGNGSFYRLPYPQAGCLYRFFSYLIILGIIYMVFSLIPSGKLRVGNLGKRTLQVYVYHGLIFQVLFHTGFFEWLAADFTLARQVAVLLLAIGLTFVLALPALEAPFRVVMDNRCFLAGKANGGAG